MTEALALADRWRGSFPRLRFWPKLEAALAVIVILLFSGALITPLFVNPDKPEASGPLLRMIWPPVYLASLFLVALRPMPVLNLVLRAWPILMLACLPVVSAVWSIDPETTFRRGIGVVMTAVFGLWLASRYGWRDLLRLLALVMAILVFGSIIAGALFPGFGIMDSIHPGAWKGLWFEKNRFGAMMAFAILAFIAASIAARDQREVWLWRSMIPIAFGLVLLSTSATALLVALLVTAGAAMIALARRGFGFAAVAIFAGLCFVAAGAGLVLLGQGVVLGWLGRDATLTGRWEIWPTVIDMVQARPLTGYGYGVFWEDAQGPLHWVIERAGFKAANAHNAWLDTALALGLPGLLLAIWVYSAALARALGCLFRGVEAYWVLPFLAAWGLMSLVESNLLSANGMIWMLICVVAAKLAEPRMRSQS